MTSPTTSKRTTRLLVRFAASGALALTLAGGITAAAASAAPAPAPDVRSETAPAGPIGEVVIVEPTVPTIPEPPDPGPERPDPKKPCKDLPDNIHVPKECRPDPCKEQPKQGYKVPDRCRPDPCKDKGEKPKGEKPRGQKDQADSPEELRRHPEPGKCPPPPPKKCEEPKGCDRPVPGKPTFTG